MGNFFNNGTQILKLIVRVRIYHISREKIVEFFRFISLSIYRSQTDYI